MKKKTLTDLYASCSIRKFWLIIVDFWWGSVELHMKDWIGAWKKEIMLFEFSTKYHHNFTVSLLYVNKIVFSYLNYIQYWFNIRFFVGYFYGNGFLDFFLMAFL